MGETDYDNNKKTNKQNKETGREKGKLLQSAGALASKEHPSTE